MIDLPAGFIFLLRYVMKRLETSEIVQIDYIPKKLVTYCKETQTPVASNVSEGKTQYIVNHQHSAFSPGLSSYPNPPPNPSPNP